MELASIIYSLKALHIIGFVAWFSGLFYIVRIFIYYVEAEEQPEAAATVLKTQFAKMSESVYNVILKPARIITWLGGIGMLIANPDYLSQPWIHIKLVLVILLSGYHDYCNRIRKNLLAGTNTMNSRSLRMYNEVATLFLVAIVLDAVFGKIGYLNYFYWGLTIVVSTILLMIGIKQYAKRQGKK